MAPGFRIVLTISITTFTSSDLKRKSGEAVVTSAKSRKIKRNLGQEYSRKNKEGLVTVAAKSYDGEFSCKVDRTYIKHI